MTPAKLEAFLAAARDLGVSAVNYIAADGETPELLSIHAGSRETTVAIAAALGMPEPSEVEHSGKSWLSTGTPNGDIAIRSDMDDLLPAQELAS